jgi:hypothetical protein
MIHNRGNGVKKILFACAIVVALVAALLVQFHFNPYAYADPPTPSPASPP